MVTIYKITNRLNEKLYVGLTQQPIEKRFLQHAKARTPLGNAMRACGLENFTIEVIEQCETLEQAKERERFWIRVLNCKVPNGYNQRDGGEGGHRKKSEVFYSTNAKTIGERVRQLRTELKLTQEVFGQKLKLSQRAIGHIEKGINGLSPRNFENICRTFNVNPHWLEYGEGEMFMPPPEKDFLDLLAEEKGLSDEEKILIGSIIDLPKSARQGVIDWAFHLVTAIEAQASEEQKERQIRELERSIAEQQKQLEKLKGSASPYVEDSSTEAG